MSKLLTSKRFFIWTITFLFIIYAIIFGVYLVNKIDCWNTGIDFCAYWTAGKAAFNHGAAGVYDTNILVQYQENVFPRKFEEGAPYEYVPFPYPPIFVLPFEIFALVPLQTSFLIWTGLKFVVFSLYMWFFVRNFSGLKFPWKLFILILFSAPFYNDLRFGQMNLWLAIIVAEFVRNMIKSRKYLAGILLSLLAFKFQLLILIVPFLLYKRELKAISGLLTGGLGVAFGSLAVAGLGGIEGFITILLNSAEGYSAANVQRMGNWRMVGEVIDKYTNSSIGIYFVLVGMLITLFYLFRRIGKVPLNNEKNHIFVFGSIFIATTIVTWHAHIEMNMVFSPLLLIAVVVGWIRRTTFGAWVSIGIVNYVLTPTLFAVFYSAFGDRYNFGHLFVTLHMIYFGVNLWVLYEWVGFMETEGSGKKGTVKMIGV